MGRAAVAFGLTVAAGSATWLGSAVVFAKGMSASPHLLSAALAASAGVMLYVSFVEIMPKSLDAFETHFGESGDGGPRSSASATASFFLGVIMTSLLDALIARMLKTSQAALDPAVPHAATQPPSMHATPTCEPPVRDSGDEGSGSWVSAEEEILPNTCPDSRDAKVDGSGSADEVASAVTVVCDEEAPGAFPTSTVSPITDSSPSSTGGDPRLASMTWVTVLALTAHQIPEGAATFLGAMADPAVGVGLAVAIAMHNVPEGAAVAVPLAHASGSKWRGFLVGVATGAAEPLGGAIAWAALGDGASDLGFGVAFGAVAGIMVRITLEELLPHARRGDPQNKVTSGALWAGMAVMAASLVLFQL